MAHCTIIYYIGNYHIIEIPIHTFWLKLMNSWRSYQIRTLLRWYSSLLWMRPVVSWPKELQSRLLTLTLLLSWAWGSHHTGLYLFFHINDQKIDFPSHPNIIDIKLTCLESYLIRGGILFWADSLGSKYICSRLEEWTRLYGDFFKPSAYLAERAAKGASLVRIQNCAFIA